MSDINSLIHLRLIYTYKYTYISTLMFCQGASGLWGTERPQRVFVRQVGLCTAIWTAPPGLLDAWWTPVVRSWTPLGRSWALLDASWTPLGRLLDTLGRTSWPTLGLSWGLSRRHLELALRTARTNCKMQRSVITALLRLGSTWSLLGATWSCH